MVASSCLLELYFQASDEGLDCLIGPGICLGVLLLTIVFVAFPDSLAEIKNISLQSSGKLLKKHQARFYCHICGKPSPRPYEYLEPDWDGKGQLFGEFVVTEWDQPTELVQCSRCQNWTCPNADPPHMENGVCKYCLENRPVQVVNKNSSIKEVIDENSGILIAVILAIILIWILNMLLFHSN